MAQYLTIVAIIAVAIMMTNSKADTVCVNIDEKTMDLIVKVKEAPTGNIQLGGGYGSFGGLLLSVAVNDRNVFGSGINYRQELIAPDRLAAQRIW